jgi:hemoglobin
MLKQHRSEERSEQKPSLYDRLGGVYAIAAIVDDFIDRIVEKPRLIANPQVNETHRRVSKAGLKYLITEMVCWATGGPQRYTGRSMLDSRALLGITEQEWQVFLADLQASFDKFAVPQAEQGELFAIVESTKNDIVLNGTAKTTLGVAVINNSARRYTCSFGVDWAF